MPRPGIGTTAPTRRLRQLVSAVSIKKTGGYACKPPGGRDKSCLQRRNGFGGIEAQFLPDSAARSRETAGSAAPDGLPSGRRTDCATVLPKQCAVRKKNGGKQTEACHFRLRAHSADFEAKQKPVITRKKTGRTAQPPHVRFLTCPECRASGFFYLFRINGAKPAYSSASASFALPVSGSYRY